MRNIGKSTEGGKAENDDENFAHFQALLPVITRYQVEASIRERTVRHFSPCMRRTHTSISMQPKRVYMNHG
jgi:hypothetical protein